MLNEGNQIHNFIWSMWELLWFHFIYYGFGTVITDPVPLRSVIKLRFLFRYGKKGSGSAKPPSVLLLSLIPLSVRKKKKKKKHFIGNNWTFIFQHGTRWVMNWCKEPRSPTARRSKKTSPQLGAINHFLPTAGKPSEEDKKLTRSPPPT